MNPTASAGNRFWTRGRGAVHHGFASPDPDARAGYIRRAAEAAARLPWTETWTNSAALGDGDRVDIHRASDFVVTRALETAETRRDAAAHGERGKIGPGGIRPVIVVILDLVNGAGTPDGLGNDALAIPELLSVDRRLGISVTIVLASPGLNVIDSPVRRMLDTEDTAPGGPGLRKGTR